MKTPAIDLRTGQIHKTPKAARAWLKADDAEMRSDINARALGMTGRALACLLRSPRPTTRADRPRNRRPFALSR